MCLQFADSLLTNVGRGAELSPEPPASILHAHQSDHGGTPNPHLLTSFPTLDLTCAWQETMISEAATSEAGHDQPRQAYFPWSIGLQPAACLVSGSASAATAKPVGDSERKETCREGQDSVNKDSCDTRLASTYQFWEEWPRA